MFLNYLNSECREYVMDLTIYVALANDVLEKEETDILEQYYHELGIPNRGFEPKAKLEEVYSQIVKYTSLRERKMILFEVVAIASVDGVCDKKEKEFMEEICNCFGVEKGLIDKMLYEIYKLRSLYIEIADVIGKEE